MRALTQTPAAAAAGAAAAPGLVNALLTGLRDGPDAVRGTLDAVRARVGRC
jgi:hypothetical protein